MRVLVAGASGVLGQPTVRELLEAGHEVVGLARDQRAEEIVRELGAEAAPGDVLDQAAVSRAAEGAEAIVNLTGALPTGRDGKAGWEQLERVWRQGTQHLLAAGQRSEVQVFVHASLGLLYGEHGESWVTEETALARESSDRGGAGGRTRTSRAPQRRVCRPSRSALGRSTAATPGTRACSRSRPGSTR